MFHNRREVFDRKFWNSSFVLFVTLLFFFPIFSNGNSQQLNNSSLLLESENSKQDILPAATPTIWKRLSYSIGYSGGKFWSFKNLQKEAGSGIDFGAPFYWINLVEAGIIYPLNKKKEIEIALGYSFWQSMQNRIGISLTIPNDDSATGDIYVYATDWDLSALNLSLRIDNTGSPFFVGAISYLCRASTIEIPYSRNITVGGNVDRYCLGGGIFCGWERSSPPSKFQWQIFTKLQLGLAKEIYNNSNWEWKEKLTISLNGISVGIRFKIGDKK